MSFFKSFAEKLKNAGNKWTQSVSNLFSDDPVDEVFWDELEEQLILGDVGIETTEELITELAGAVGQNDCAANLLVCVTGVNAQLYVQLDGLIELSLRGGNNGGKRFSRIVLLGAVDRLCAVYILFTFMHNKSSLSG